MQNICHYEHCINEQYRLSEQEWQLLCKKLPIDRRVNKVGRPAICWKSVLNGVAYVLKTGCQWKALPYCFGAPSTIHGRFQILVTDGVFMNIWSELLSKYDAYCGLQLATQIADCALVKAPLGGENTGINFADKYKFGSKRSMLTDACGIPLSIIISSARIHDSKLLEMTIAHKLNTRSHHSQEMQLDAAYDARIIKKMLVSYGYKPAIAHNRRRSPVKKTYEKLKNRWVVERSHSWINRFRRLLVRWDKKAVNHLALIQFACSIIISSKLPIFG